MKTHLLVFTFILSFHSFGNISYGAFIGPKAYSMHIYQIYYQFGNLTYFQYLQLPKVYSFKEHREVRIWQSDIILPLFQLNHNASVDFFLDEREILEITARKKDIFQFQVYASGLFEQSSYSARASRTHFSVYNPFRGTLLPVDLSTTTMLEPTITFKGSVSAKVISIILNPKCIEMAGIMGLENCSKTVVYELFNEKEIGIYGKYVQAIVDHNSSEYLGQIVSLSVSRYSDNTTMVTSFDGIGAYGQKELFPSKYYSPAR